MIILQLLAIAFIFTFLFAGIRACWKEWKYTTSKLDQRK